ncbi:Crp/Fnr family transcriptional regulator [Erythrobacter sp.]|uniref:Crp/Fnr family transcriptional regulator n=1 Tax=Erythrobacter sp. TaxID=1042 RepID=UPI0025D7B988|nr:Crp/Fnr family transcriptional regulator [Erythrobacter sp.]
MKSHFISRLRSPGLPDDTGPVLLSEALSESKSFPARQVICRGDSELTGFPVIISGWAARCQFVLDGGRQITGLLVPGDLAYLGRMPGQVIDEEIVALSTCKVAWLPALVVEELVASHPVCGIALRSYAALEYAMAISWLVNVGRRDAFERMAHFICEIHYRLSRVGLVQGAEFLFPLKQHELADVLGLAPVHVNRKIQQLRQEGLIALKGRHLEILDLARLRHMAGFQSAYLGDLATIDKSDPAGRPAG